MLKAVFPILLSFANPSLEKRARFKIPEWLAAHPTFLDAVRQCWGEAQTRISQHPAKRWRDFKKCVRECAIKFMKSFRAEAYSKATSLTLGLGLLRAAQSQCTPESLRSLAQQNPQLLRALDADLSTCTPGFQRVDEYVRACFSSQPLLDPQGGGGKPNFCKSAKRTLPHGKQSLNFLNTEDGKRVEDAAGMANMLKEHWEPVWNRPNPQQAVIDRYLESYNKLIDGEKVAPLSLALVVGVIAKRRDSSTGPDGIPFSTYRSLTDIVAPLLLELIRHLSDDQKPNRSFNFTNLFFFPKDSSNTVNRLRPISVSNTDNRLVANIVREAILPAIVAILAKSQRAFVPGGSIDDNILYFNEVFYSQLEQGAGQRLPPATA